VFKGQREHQQDKEQTFIVNQDDSGNAAQSARETARVTAGDEQKDKRSQVRRTDGPEESVFRVDHIGENQRGRAQHFESNEQLEEPADGATESTEKYGQRDARGCVSR